MKKCNKCLETKDITEFYKDRQKRDGISTYCAKCIAARTAKYRLDNLDKVRATDKIRALKRNKTPRFYDNYCRREYGITLAEFNDILNLQEGKCAICEQVLPTRTEQNLGHNHDTKQVRGILCTMCNTGIGYFRDQSRLLEIAAAYLRGYDAWAQTTLQS